MPLPNEHSCRLRDPGDFQPDSFRRMEREHEGKRYDAIAGRLKGETSLTEQAYRYPKKTWPAREACAHCRDHDGDCEPAREEEGQGAAFAALGTALPGRPVQSHIAGVMRAALETPWAILPSTLAVIMEIASRHAAGEHLTPEEVAARTRGGPGRPGRIEGDIAVLPLTGVIVPRANLMAEVSGATSAERFGAAFRQLMADPQIGAVVIDVDSPGGAVQGVEELSSLIYDARGTKPIFATANHLAASAAYWIASAADEFIVTPSAEVGGIGVFAAHEDLSAAMEKLGVKTTYVSAGRYKTEANPHEALSGEARAAIQTRVDDYYGLFVRAVARNRGVNAAQVQEGYGQGRVVGARRALQLGMADRLETLDETLKRLTKRTKSTNARSAAAETDFRRRRMRADQSPAGLDRP